MRFAISDAAVAAAVHIHFRRRVWWKVPVVRPTLKNQGQSAQTEDNGRRSAASYALGTILVWA
jgi:hypothetical protein